MSQTADTVARHELVGLFATVVQSANPDLEGVRGTVVAESTNTLDLEDEGFVRTVPKDVARFAFTLPSGSVVTVDGDRLVARPARRTEMRGDSRWR